MFVALKFLFQLHDSTLEVQGFGPFGLDSFAFSVNLFLQLYHHLVCVPLSYNIGHLTSWHPSLTPLSIFIEGTETTWL